jgi:hypothetical protein
MDSTVITCSSHPLQHSVSARALVRTGLCSNEWRCVTRRSRAQQALVSRFTTARCSHIARKQLYLYTSLINNAAQMRSACVVHGIDIPLYKPCVGLPTQLGRANGTAHRRPTALNQCRLLRTCKRGERCRTLTHVHVLSHPTHELWCRS